MNEEATPESAHTKLNTSIDHELVNLVEDLERVATHFTGQKSPGELLIGLRQKIEDGTINSITLEHKIFTVTSTSSQDERKSSAISLAFIYTALVQISSHENQPAKAWSAATRAKYYIGLLEGIYSSSTGKIEKGTDRAKKRAVDGGKKKDENQEIIKELIIKKLCSTSADTNFSSTEEAAQWLALQLESELTKRRILKDKAKGELPAIFKEMIDTDHYIGIVYNSRTRLR